MQAVVDRIEGERAELVVTGTGGGVLEMPLALLPPVSEGDVLEISVAKDDRATEAARGRVEGFVAKLKGTRAGGSPDDRRE